MTMPISFFTSNANMWFTAVLYCFMTKARHANFSCPFKTVFLELPRYPMFTWKINLNSYFYCTNKCIVYTCIVQPWQHYAGWCACIKYKWVLIYEYLYTCTCINILYTFNRFLSVCFRKKCGLDKILLMQLKMYSLRLYTFLHLKHWNYILPMYM